MKSRNNNGYIRRPYELDDDNVREEKIFQRAERRKLREQSESENEVVDDSTSALSRGKADTDNELLG